MTNIIDAGLVPHLPSLVLSRLEQGSTLEYRDDERPLRRAGVGVLAGRGLLVGIGVARGAVIEPDILLPTVLPDRRPGQCPGRDRRAGSSGGMLGNGRRVDRRPISARGRGARGNGPMMDIIDGR